MDINSEAPVITRHSRVVGGDPVSSQPEALQPGRGYPTAAAVRRRGDGEVRHTAVTQRHERTLAAVSRE
jgi:hypothetical protein